MSVYFTADWHFGHANIIKLCQRPFADVAEMNATIIARVNERCGALDTLVVLGDLFWKMTDHRALLAALQPEIVALRGNHDKAIPEGPRFRWLPGQIEAWKEYDGSSPISAVRTQEIVLSHYPLAEWEGFYRGVWHLHGHCHGNRPAPAGMLRLDVGVDTHDFYPWSLPEIAAYMDRQKAAA